MGDAVLYFALGWAASAHGGPVAGLVLSSIGLPRTVLLLVGGAVGDRFGARRVMITGDTIMMVVAAVLAVVSWHWGTPLALLVSAGGVRRVRRCFTDRFSHLRCGPGRADRHQALVHPACRTATQRAARVRRRYRADIVKALALGATAVAVGRPYAYGLAIGGTDGIVHVLRSLLPRPT